MVSTPFGINGLECYDGGANVSKSRVLSRTAAQSPVPSGGVRRLRQMSSQQTKGVSNIEKPTFMASLHHKGKMLVWDADTIEVVGMCDHHGCSVAQCIVTPTYVFVRVENEAGFDNEEDSKVYVWHTKTFELYRRLVAHDGRVTSIVVSDQNDSCFATAGIDHAIHLWDLTKNVMGPVRKISVGGGATVLLYFSGMILGGFTQAPLMAWDAETGEEVLRVKDGTSAVTAVRWLHDPSRVTRRPGKSHQRSAALLIGYSDGFVKQWSVEAGAKALSMSIKWANKVHRAHVTDVCGDDDVVLSCSTLDGAFLLMPSRGQVAPLVSYGVRVALLDTCSKNAVIGVDDGSVEVISYSDFAAGLGEPAVIASFRPHTSGVTGLFLQLSEDLSWDRLICSGADGTIAFMDYSKVRGGRWLKGMGAQSVDYISNGGAILIPKAANGGIFVIDPLDILPFATQPNVQITQTITSVRWSESTNKLVLGSDEGMLMVFEGTVAEDRTPSFHKIEQRHLRPYFSRSIFLSEPDGSLAVVNLQKNYLSYEGGFMIVDLKGADLMFPVQPLMKMFPIRSSLVTFQRSEAYDYAVVLQLRDGSILQYVGNSIRKTTPVFVRTLVEPFLADVLQMELSGLSVYPSNYVLDVLPTVGGVVDLLLTYANDTVMTQLKFSAVPGGPLDSHIFAKKNSAAIGGPFSSETEMVVSLQAIHQGDLGFAILRDSPSVDIITTDGEYLYRISYEGNVRSYQAMSYRRRSRSFPFDTSVLNNNTSLAPDSSPAACAADFCAEARYLALGYRDGMVQLFDTTQQIIFTRFAVHTSMISGIWAFPHAVISATLGGDFHGGAVFRRVMFDDTDSKGPSPDSSLMLLRRTSASVSVIGP
ncbi:hypothetical protein DQ04_00911040 [Trypanosoma grayi]|uniref:hypothetical protein n=1 Tax=Trypanosoma grayi TaxID=71804 RepID=UPI0004F45B8B|nr:hypothetical protein DQ04_00911040 [Trypanosoma grayi]KEG13592.1 hypothetical protein DQ04_00911040 [Trypanosoma grayi]